MLLKIIFPLSNDFSTFLETTSNTIELLLLHYYKSFFNLGTTVTTNSSLLYQNCFHGNGQRYTGKTNTTISGKSCVQWNRISYLNNNTFPMLKKNYCRNPEGYGLKPWCYVGIKDRKWEYCKIRACAIDEGNEGTKGEY